MSRRGKTFWVAECQNQRRAVLEQHKRRRNNTQCRRADAHKRAKKKADPGRSKEISQKNTTLMGKKIAKD